MTQANEQVRCYSELVWSVPLGLLISIPVLWSAAPFVLWSDFSAIAIPALAIFAVLAVTYAYGNCFLFDRTTATVTVTPRLLLLFRFTPVVIPWSHITKLEWITGADGDGGLYMECANVHRFGVTGNKAKAERIKAIVSAKCPSLKDRAVRSSSQGVTCPS